MGIFDWFRRKKDSEDLSLKSTEFPWPKERLTNHIRGEKHWQNSRCLGSDREALRIRQEKETKKRHGACSNCGNDSRVTAEDRPYRHLPVLGGV